VVQGKDFKGRQFTAEMILRGVRWCLMFPISYRDLELMPLDRGVKVDHMTIFRSIQAHAVELEKRIRPHLQPSNGSWRVDETYIRMKGRWVYLYRAVDSRGQTTDFLLSAKRDAAGAKRFFGKALAQPHTVNPRDEGRWRTVAPFLTTSDKVPRQHRRTRSPTHKRLTGPGLGFGGFWTPRRTLAGFGVMAMIRKRRVRNIVGNDVMAQGKFIAELFQVAA
jgi:transposase, IS6 family